MTTQKSARMRNGTALQFLWGLLVMKIITCCIRGLPLSVLSTWTDFTTWIYALVPAMIFAVSHYRFSRSHHNPS
ncbi:hypothetical protein SAMN05216246_10243 [Actinomyces denticolens]|uniref:Uncharacterized protein n=1 Tax=Actinomyces denticolens TaxID=52767 RepID=A0ABY1I0J6_9ACTO|nr:hypothetical protein SAMN05216246_10243 [Actinomyces denticolens]SUU08019.1 Uncharacterised protein [Actinomyces denticolens]